MIGKEYLLNIPVSFYRNMKLGKTKDVSVGQALDAIKGTFYEAQVKNIRQLKTEGRENEAKQQKELLHAVTFCATFEDKRQGSLYQHYNRLMVIDIDKLEPDEMERVKNGLEENPLVAAYWKSPSGNGWKGLVALNYQNEEKRMDAVDMHHWAFGKLEEDFKERYNITLDASGKDITRLCFMSWSPELRLKDEFEAFDVDLKEMEAEAKKAKQGKGERRVLLASGEPIPWNKVDGLQQEDRQGTPHDKRTIDDVYKFLKARHESITGNYNDWVKVAFAIANTFHSTYGRRIFMKLCELDGAAHNEARSERLIYDAYTAGVKRSEFRSIIYLAKGKGFNL